MAGYGYRVDYQTKRGGHTTVYTADLKVVRQHLERLYRPHIEAIAHDTWGVVMGGVQYQNQDDGTRSLAQWQEF